VDWLTVVGIPAAIVAVLYGLVALFTRHNRRYPGDDDGWGRR
jgi:hypothetical protein